MQDLIDPTYMSHAIKLAKLGRYTVSPNPMVGCVIVREGNIVGEGYHQRAGEAHAEIRALQAAGDKAAGATAYISLEPCCHHGRTPPCTDALIKSGIKKVVVACQDPNPLMSGMGITALQNAGIEVISNVMENEAATLNEIFFHYMTTRRPFVIAKWAMSLDGKMTTHPDDNRQISSDASHQQVHDTRQCVDAILVGKDTVIHDDPLLTVRLPAITKKQPIRIVLSTRGDIPLDRRIINTHNDAKTIVITTALADKEQIAQLHSKQVTTIVVKLTKDNRVDLHDAVTKLGELGITSILVEGGRKIHESFFNANLVNKVDVYVAPIIIGAMNKRMVLDKLTTAISGCDYHLSGEITHV